MAKKRRSKKKSSKKRSSISRNVILLISIGLTLLLGFMDMPNPLAQFVRLLAFIGYVILAYYALKGKKWLWVAVFLIIGMLSQPFYGYAGGETIWNIIDIILVIVIGYAVYKVAYPKIKLHISK